MPLDGPFSWHEAHLVSEEGWNMMGVTFPGSAVLTIGSNNLLGWTHTVNHPDLTDVYHLEIHPDDPDLYRFGSEWLRLEKKETKLRVRAVLGVKLQVKKEILHSVFGPVIRTEKGTFAIRTTVFQRIGACEQWYRMSKSQNFSQFREALGLQQIPSLNVLYADRSDTIMYLNNGLFPYRDPAFDWTSILDGTNPATLWEPDFHPLEDLPMVINPEQGFLFNTNNSPFKCVPFGPNPDPAAFDPTMGFRMFENNRSTRVREMVSGMGKIGLQDLKRIKYDIRMPDSIRFQVDLMAFWDLDENRYQDLAPAIRKLHQWNRSSAATNEDAALFLLAWENLYERLHLHDSEPPYGLRLPEHYYVEALSDAARTLEKQFGSLDVPLGALQRYIRGEKNYPLSGMPDVLAFMYALPQKKGARKAMIGDSFVGFIRFGKKETAFETVLPYGASANPESPHFSDQMDLMHMHQTKQMTFDRLSILQQAEAVYSPSPTGLWAGKD
jgi:acyl-homoserine-lactone acylase